MATVPATSNENGPDAGSLAPSLKPSPKFATRSDNNNLPIAPSPAARSDESATQSDNNNLPVAPSPAAQSDDNNLPVAPSEDDNPLSPNNLKMLLIPAEDFVTALQDDGQMNKKPPHIMKYPQLKKLSSNSDDMSTRLKYFQYCCYMEIRSPSPPTRCM